MLWAYRHAVGGHEAPSGSQLSLAAKKIPFIGRTTNPFIAFFIFFYFVLWPKNAQLFHKSSHSYMFRHYRVILRELVINKLPSYTSNSNAAVGNTIYN